MTITIDAELVTLLVIGLMAGTLAAMLFESGRRTNRMILRNLIIGVLGAFLGSIIFDQLNLRDEIPEFLSGEISLAEVLVAFVGASILMLVARVIRR